MQEMIPCDVRRAAHMKRENMKPREGKHETLDAVAGSKARMWLLVGNVRVYAVSPMT